MVHVHGRAVLERTAVGVPARAQIAVPVDVGKLSAMAMVADFTGERLVSPFVFLLDRGGIGELITRVHRAVVERGARRVNVGVGRVRRMMSHGVRRIVSVHPGVSCPV